MFIDKHDVLVGVPGEILVIFVGFEFEFPFVFVLAGALAGGLAGKHP